MGTDNNQEWGYGFFREIPKDILQNLLNESKIVSYKKKGSDFFIHAAEQKQCILCIPEK